MDVDKQNVNPTILNASDLPSRRREAPARSRDDGGSGLFDTLIPRYNYLNDPFDHVDSSSDTASDEVSSGSDDDIPEYIDEQEVYGESCASPATQAPSCSPMFRP